jgi:catechol 2,3-dioxygenase
MLVRGINHVVLKVRNLEESDRFYREFVGLKLVGRRGHMRFYTAGAHTHDFAIVEIGAAPPVNSRGLGLFHFCFDVRDEVALRALYTTLKGAGVAVSSGVDHNVMHSFYAHDPDGNVVEFGVDVPEQEWDGTDVWAEDKSYELV